MNALGEVTVNQSSVSAEAEKLKAIVPKVAEKIVTLRAQIRESFGKIAMAMMENPRYRHQSIGDLKHILLEPLIRDRVAIAYSDC